MSETGRDIDCKLWVVLDLDDEDRPPLAIFPSKAEALAWMTLTGWHEACQSVEVCEADMVISLPPPEEPREEGSRRG